VIALKIYSTDLAEKERAPATIDLYMTKRDDMKERTKGREREREREWGGREEKGQDGDSTGMQQK